VGIARRNRCEGHTREGERCKRHPKKGRFCNQHRRKLREKVEKIAWYAGTAIAGAAASKTADGVWEALRDLLTGWSVAFFDGKKRRDRYHNAWHVWRAEKAELEAKECEVRNAIAQLSDDELLRLADRND